MAPPTTYYCQIGDVSEFLAYSAFTSSTKPTDTAVAKIINRAEDEIDQRTHHAWRTVTVTNELHNLDDYYMLGYGVEIRLLHRAIKTFSYAAGDRIQYWNGTGWQDLFTSGDVMDSSISYIDYEQGRIHTKSSFFSFITEYKFRVTYRYGEATVPNDIANCAILMTCIQLLNTNFRTNLLPQANWESIENVITQWRESVERILQNRAEWVIIGS